ncbi:MAG: patatin-like phospholipase family protein [Ginsengibacter sp.]
MEEKKFHLGLCLAGAVSAGAYSAGVMDYLFETLEKWEKRKEENSPDTPSHHIVIDVIGGASAGGMTGIIAAAALSNEIKPVKFPTNADEVLAEQPQNKFYHSWVDMSGKDTFAMMLETKDVDEDKKVTSLLNSCFIDKIAKKILEVDMNNLKPLPAYINTQLKVFTTLTNLEGFPFQISFKGNTSPDKYYMAIHNDYACFQFNKDENKKDGWMLLDFKSGKNVDTAIDAALATGAFPIALKSRKLTRKTDEVNSMKWLMDVDPVEGTDYTSLNIDGGTIDNKPFAKVREVLIDITQQDDPEIYNDPNLFNSTIIFIDPFPSEEMRKIKIDDSIFRTFGYSLNTLVGQSRTNRGIISDAINTHLAGQFMIAPSRRRPTLSGEEERVAGGKAIACGGFVGFSGFINKEFRVHDYFLGRFNCEMMLRNRFIIPESALEQNEIFREGYKGVDKSKFCIVREEKQIVIEKEKLIMDGVETEREVNVEKIVKKKYYPIIPLFETRTDQFPMPVFSSGTNWPVIEAEKVEHYRPLIKKRSQAILFGIIKGSQFHKALVWIGAKLVLNKTMSDAALNSIKKALKNHQLLK